VFLCIGTKIDQKTTLQRKRLLQGTIKLCMTSHFNHRVQLLVLHIYIYIYIYYVTANKVFCYFYQTDLIPALKITIPIQNPSQTRQLNDIVLLLWRTVWYDDNITIIQVMYTCTYKQVVLNVSF